MKAYELKLENQAIENILNLPKLAKFRYKKFQQEVNTQQDQEIGKKEEKQDVFSFGADNS